MKTPIPDREFTELVQQNEKLIYKACSLYASEHVPLADLYQEVVYNLWRSFPKFRKEAAPSTWIYRIALNTCISAIRKEMRRPKTMPVESFAAMLEEPGTMEEEIRQMYRLIEKLSTIDKALIMLYLEDKPHREIAQITGLTPGNVAVRLKRIRDRLKQMT